MQNSRSNVVSADKDNQTDENSRIGKAFFDKLNLRRRILS